MTDGKALLGKRVRGADRGQPAFRQAAQRGVAGLVADAERGADLVVTRRNHPVAALVGIARLEMLEAAESDLRDLAPTPWAWHRTTSQP